MKSLVAIILAGGRSKRFWPLSDKNLFNFTGGNLVEYHLQTLSALGVKNFVVICSPDVAAFLRVNSKKFANLTIHRLIQNNKNHGIGNAVLLAKEILEQKYPGKPVYIINSDDLYNSSVHEKLYSKLLNSQTQVGVVGYEVNEYQPHMGYFALEGDRVCAVIEKPKEADIPSNITNMSLHLYKNSSLIIKALEKEKEYEDKNDDLYERALNRICKENSVSSIIYSGRFEVLKYPWHVLKITDYFLQSIKSKISQNTIIDKSAKIVGQVIIEDNVKILEFATIKGPVIVKSGTIIGTGSVVRDSIVGKDCVVGYHTEIARSYIGDNCWFHTNYIGDSVISNKVSFGSGAVTANLRLDCKHIHSLHNNQKINTQRVKLGAIIGSNTQIGVNGSLMPGVKVGKNSLVGPGVIQYKDLEDNTRVLLQQQTIKKNNSITTVRDIRKNFRDILNSSDKK